MQPVAGHPGVPPHASEAIAALVLRDRGPRRFRSRSTAVPLRDRRRLQLRDVRAGRGDADADLRRHGRRVVDGRAADARATSATDGPTTLAVERSRDPLAAGRIAIQSWADGGANCGICVRRRRAMVVLAYADDAGRPRDRTAACRTAASTAAIRTAEAADRRVLTGTPVDRPRRDRPRRPGSRSPVIAVELSSSSAPSGSSRSGARAASRRRRTGTRRTAAARCPARGSRPGARAASSVRRRRHRPGSRSGRR